MHVQCNWLVKVLGRVLQLYHPLTSRDHCSYMVHASLYCDVTFSTFLNEFKLVVCIFLKESPVSPCRNTCTHSAKYTQVQYFTPCTKAKSALHWRVDSDRCDDLRRWLILTYLLIITRLLKIVRVSSYTIFFFVLFYLQLFEKCMDRPTLLASFCAYFFSLDFKIRW